MKKLLILLTMLAAVICPAAYLIPTEISQLVRPVDDQSPIVFRIRDTAIEFGNSWMSRKSYANNKHLTGEIPDQTPPDDLSFIVNDYNGQPVGSGTLVKRSDGNYELIPFWTENGYYEIVLPGFESQAIGILVIPPNLASTDEFFAMDACFTCFYDHFTPDRHNSFASILDYCGIRKIRDRLKWRCLQPNNGDQLEMEMGAFNGAARREISKSHHLDTLDVFHEKPIWINSLTRKRGFPDDLLSTAHGWSTIGKGYAPYWDTLEIWNEIDLGDSDCLPADQYCAFLKAISKGFQRSGIPTNLAACAYAAFSDGHWQNKLPCAVENGMLENTDVFSFHNYQEIESIQENTGYFRNYLEGNPRQGIPIYMTETGMPWESMDKDRPVLNDELHSSAAITGKAIESKAVGIARYYVFVLNSYDENNKNFGLFDRHDTPLRNFASYATCCRLLSGYEYIGDIQDCGRAFGAADSVNAYVTFICKAGEKKTIPEWLQRQDTVLLQADGRILAQNGQSMPDLGLEQNDTLYYLQVPRQALDSHLNTNTEAMRLLNIARNYQPTPRLNLPGIIQYHIDDSTNRNWSLRGYYFYDLSRVEFDICFNNLSDQPITFCPVITLPEGAVVLQSMPEVIQVNANSRQSSRIALDLTKTFSLGQNDTYLKITDKNGNADILAIRLNTKHWLNKVYANHGIDHNIAEKLTKAFKAAKDAGIDTTTKFHPLFDGIYFGGQQNWEQEEGCASPDIEAQFMVNYDADTLQLIVQVRDDNEFLQKNPANDMWRGDSVQFCFQTGRLSNQNTELTVSECQGKPMIFAHFTQNQVGDEFYHGQPIAPEEAQILHLDEHNYVFIATIDLIRLEQEGIQPNSEVSFCLLVNSSDGNVRSGYLKWGDGIGRFKDNGYFNQLIPLP